MRLPVSTILFGLLVPTIFADEGRVEFNRDIRPLFSKHCTACHGGVKEAGGISFVYRGKALTEGKSGETAIMPGRPEESELMRRVRSRDPDEVMPQPDHGPRLSDEEIGLLSRWIAQGAEWSEHWAFVPPVEKTPPAVKNAAWPRTVADRWVLARIEAEGLVPAGPAGAAAWLRRVTLDLTGLPPSREEFVAFEQEWQADPQQAREVAVERLLASPHYGERWAGMWLDLARYSDSFGFEKDPHRQIWPWRDWVIRAFNDDMPFDQFTVRQLAGDLLPDAGAEDLLATAFHRNTQNNSEGGTDDEEFRTASVLDRVNTTWTVWQATTFGCVQCHAHPYDPFPHADYYRFAAFFNNTEDCDQNNDFPRLPFHGADGTRQAQMVEDHRRHRAEREALNGDGLKLAADPATPWKALVPVRATSTAGTLAIAEDGRVEAGGTLPIGLTYTVEVPAPVGVTALRLDIEPDADDPKKWPERGSVLSHLSAAVRMADGKSQPVELREVIADFIAGPFDAQATLAADGAGFGGFPVLTGPRWCVVVLKDALPAAEGAVLELRMDQNASYNSGFQAVPLRQFRWAASSDARWELLGDDEARIARHAEVKRLADALAKGPGTQVPVMLERAAAATRPTRVFQRGNRLTPGDVVTPGIPELSRAPEEKDGLTRLDMARWLVSDANTLTARVLANRLWAELFGLGIVTTLEDFGTSGARPAHPELLDHLALRLRGAHRWSVKGFLREIVLGSTYAQSANVRSGLFEKDPLNSLLARGPRSRLTAEMVRDQALHLSGQLSPQLYGAPVFPPQPEGIWNIVYSSDRWVTSTGPDRYRRAIYTFNKRTSGYPSFLAFDAPPRDFCTARRIPTNTPLQALVTLNDPAYFELAEALGERMAAHPGDVRARITHGCQLLTLAAPPPAMVDSLVRLHERSLMTPGATPELALTLVANTLMNTDFALNR